MSIDFIKIYLLTFSTCQLLVQFLIFNFSDRIKFFIAGREKSRKGSNIQDGIWRNIFNLYPRYCAYRCIVRILRSFSIPYRWGIIREYGIVSMDRRSLQSRANFHSIREGYNLIIFISYRLFSLAYRIIDERMSLKFVFYFHPRDDRII